MIYKDSSRKEIVRARWITVLLSISSMSIFALCNGQRFCTLCLMYDVMRDKKKVPFQFLFRFVDSLLSAVSVSYQILSNLDISIKTLSSVNF